MNRISLHVEDEALLSFTQDLLRAHGFHHSFLLRACDVLLSSIPALSSPLSIRLRESSIALALRAVGWDPVSLKYWVMSTARCDISGVVEIRSPPRNPPPKVDNGTTSLLKVVLHDEYITTAEYVERRKPNTHLDQLEIPPE